MNKEVYTLLKKGGVFMLPIIAWGMIVLITDPFNYFNISQAIPDKAKEKSAQKLNSLLYNTIQFKNNPKQHIIIGDSRIRKLPTDRIKELTGNQYYTLHSNAAKLNEIIDLFWLANEQTELEHVIFGINFNVFNEYAYANRVADVKEMMKNPLIYIFNRNIAETVYLSLKYTLNNDAIKNKNDKDKDAFWKHTINTIATNHYAKYQYPEQLLQRLKKVNDYCLEQNIKLTLLIVPHHKEFHDRLVDYNLEKEELRFKKAIKDIGVVIDYDFPNPITNCKSCFGDPLHTTDSISRVIVEELFSDSLVIGKRL